MVVFCFFLFFVCVLVCGEVWGGMCVYVGGVCVGVGVCVCLWDTKWTYTCQFTIKMRTHKTEY